MAKKLIDLFFPSFFFLAIGIVINYLSTGSVAFSLSLPTMGLVVGLMYSLIQNNK